MDGITNDEVLRRMNLEEVSLYTIRKKKLEYASHLMRNNKYGMFQLLINRKINGKRGIDRGSVSWLKNLWSWFEKTSTDIFRTPPKIGEGTRKRKPGKWKIRFQKVRI